MLVARDRGDERYLVSGSRGQSCRKTSSPRANSLFRVFDVRDGGLGRNPVHSSDHIYVEDDVT